MIHDALAEQNVIGSCLVDAPVFRRLIDDEQLTADHFAIPDYRHAWAAMTALDDRGMAFDHIAVLAELGDHGDQAMAEILQDAIAAAQWAAAVTHARIVKHTALRRTWHDAARLLEEAAARDDESFVAQAEQVLASPTISVETSDPVQLGSDVVDWLTATGDPVAAKTGLIALDNLLAGGLRPGDTTALGAWTSMGKSVLCDQILTRTADEGARCHAYINEMSKNDRALRMIAHRTGVPYSRLAVRDLAKHEEPVVLAAAQDLPFGVTDISQWTAEQVARHIRSNRWDLCCLDVLHNMPYDDVRDLDRIIQTLCAAALSSGTHLILVCQFNELRATGSTLPPPVIRDIRGSGMIKNVCANVLLLHREQTAEGGLVLTSRDGTIYAGKSRHGTQGTVPVTFRPDGMRFVSPTRLEVVA